MCSWSAWAIAVPRSLPIWARAAPAACRIAVRTPRRQIVRRDIAGWPAHATGILVSRLPAALVDSVARLQSRLTVPDLTLRHPRAG